MTRHRLAYALLVWPLLAFGAGAEAQIPPAAAPAADASTDTRPEARERFKRFLSDAAGPVTLVENAGWAGLAQASRVPEEWGGGGNAYGKRYAALLGQGVIQEAVTYGLSAAFAVDSRFHLSRKHGFRARASDALLQAVTSRSADGHRHVSVPLCAGYTAGGLAIASWYPERFGWKDGVAFGGLALTSRSGVNLVREFILRR